MLTKFKPEQVKTELGAVAVCVGAVVTFLTAMAAFKQNFSIIEFWVFVNAGIAWFTCVTLRVLNLHAFRAELEEQRNFLSSHQKLVTAQQETIRLQTENISALNQAAALINVGSIDPPKEPHTKE